MWGTDLPFTLPTIQHWFQLQGEGTSWGRQFDLRVCFQVPLCQRGSLSVNNRASSNPASTVSAAAMWYVSSVGAPQLNAQQGEIHLAAYKLIEMQREALWNLYRLSPPMELSSENCVTLSAFTAPTVWCTLSTKHCSLRFVSERVCVCVCNCA